MSNFIPPNIIQTPDFAGLAKERIDRKRNEETSKNLFLDQFTESQGLFLDGDRPAVQDAWNKVQSTIDMVAENDTPESRRQLKQVYADYAKVAGTAQVLADQHRTQVANYKADPTKYAMSGSEFFDWDKDFRTQTRSFNDMQSALDNPNVLPSSASYALLNPFEQAQTLMAETANVTSQFYDASGLLNTIGLRNRIKEIATRKIMANPEAIERAVIWGATTSNNPDKGFAGDGDGRINSLEELNMIKQLPQEVRDEYMESYIEELVDDYMKLTPGNQKQQSDKKSLPVSPISIQAAGGKEVSFLTLPGYVNTVYNVDSQDEITGEIVSTSTEGRITQIGADPDGGLFVTIERKVKGTNDIGEATESTVIEQRPATQYEVDKIMSKYSKDYDFSALTPAPPPVEEAATETETTPEETPEETPAETSAETPAETPAETTARTDTTSVIMDPAADTLNIFNTQNTDTTATTDTAATTDTTEAPAVETTETTTVDATEAPAEEETPAEAAAEETPAEATAEETPAEEAEKTQEKGRDYVVVNGRVVFRDTYEKQFAGTRSSIGTKYPATLEEYAERFGETIKNEDDEPLQGEEVMEATVTAGELPVGAREKRDRSIVDVEREGIPDRDQETTTEEEVDTGEEGLIANMPADDVSTKGSVEDSEFRSGAPENPTIYIERGGFIPNPKSPKEGVPMPSREKVLPKTAKSFYTTKGGKKLDFEWTAENVKLAIDRWNGEFAKQTGIDYQTIIDVSNQFGIPVELIIGLAAKESELGNSNRPSKTKNLYNWGNTTKGDKRKGSEQDKKNTYFKTFEDGLYAWADGFVRLYRPDSGDWMELFQENAPDSYVDDEGNIIGIGGSFVVQRGDKKGSRYAANPEQEEQLKNMITWNIVANLSRKDPNKKSTKYIKKKLKI